MTRDEDDASPLTCTANVAGRTAAAEEEEEEEAPLGAAATDGSCSSISMASEERRTLRRQASGGNSSEQASGVETRESPSAWTLADGQRCADTITLSFSLPILCCSSWQLKAGGQRAQNGANFLTVRQQRKHSTEQAAAAAAAHAQQRGTENERTQQEPLLTRH
jgi:hypothetical protein